VRALEDDGAQHEEAASLSSASGAASPDNAFDNGGWYYPMVEIGPILAANETDFDKPGNSVPQMGIGTA
jgi:hypothetical protein